MKSMKLLALSFLVVILAVHCKHTFMGTNVQRPLLRYEYVRYSANIITKRIEHYRYSVPPSDGRNIQGILVYDLTNSTASANVTAGGLGARDVTIRLKSARGEPIKFGVYIYA